MKKIFSLIAVLVLLSGCDDGDMTFKTFDFPDDNVLNCPQVTTGKLYYKINGTEALILELADGQLLSKPTVPGTPLEISISGNNKITYRNYSTAPTNICNSLVNGTIGFDDQWTGTGAISVITTAKLGDKAPYIGKVTGYQHQITLKNITFTKGSEKITINDNLYGSVDIDNGFSFDFLPNDNDATVPPIINNCTVSNNNNLLYTNKRTRALVANLGTLESIFPSTVGEKRIGLGTNSNPNDPNGPNSSKSLRFTVFDTDVRQDKICEPGGNGIPGTPINNQRWIATSGYLVIKTTLEPTNTYKSTVYLEGVTFTNLANATVSFKIDDVITVTESGYLFGTYNHN